MVGRYYTIIVSGPTAGFGILHTLECKKSEGCMCYFKSMHSGTQTKQIYTKQEIYLKDVILALSWEARKKAKVTHPNFVRWSGDHDMTSQSRE